ncbi:MAG: hypothetical protein NTV04_20350 [Deltaproteobacteria bacterium]|nr:hypothetical protein [Deltaproteobacteria bacterium]
MKSKLETGFLAHPAQVEMIGFNNFEAAIGEEAKPVLILSMHLNGESRKEMGIIETISKKYAKAIKVCLLKEEFIGPFSEKFGVKGSPTYLLFVRGQEKGRMLGRADLKTLENFLLETVPSLGT